MLFLALVLIAAACGSDSDDGDASDDSSDTTAAADSGDSGDASSDAPKLAIVYSAEWFDGSWGEAAYDGANALLDAGLVSDIALSESVPPGAEAERALRAYAEDGYNPIIAHSFDFGDDVKKVAADFPDMKIILAHPSFPWQEEALSVATHKPNVYIDLSGWSPKYFPPILVRYTNTLLQDKMLFGSDWPVITADRWLADFAKIDIRDEVRPKVLKANARRLLGL